MSNFFPIHINAEETPHFTSSSYKFRPLFLANKPTGMSWYAYNVIIHSPTNVEFVVYDMFCSARGGIGKEVGSFEATASAELTAPYIQKHAVSIAQYRIDEERRAANKLILKNRAEDVLAEFGLS